jgi:hypothetical protein
VRTRECPRRSLPGCPPQASGGSGRRVCLRVGGTASASLAAFRAFASRARPAVYRFQCGLHIRPRPSFWLGWLGKSAMGASWASIPNRAEPMHRRRSGIVIVLSSVAAGLAVGRPSITPIARRCKSEDRGDDGVAPWGPQRRLAQPDRRPRRRRASRARAEPPELAYPPGRPATGDPRGPRGGRLGGRGPREPDDRPRRRRPPPDRARARA